MTCAKALWRDEEYFFEGPRKALKAGGQKHEKEQCETQLERQTSFLH